jgi:hypothetical protein
MIVELLLGKPPVNIPATPKVAPLRPPAAHQQLLSGRTASTWASTIQTAIGVPEIQLFFVLQQLSPLTTQ